jgi:hypothetical protein
VRLTFRVNHENDRHAFVTVFQDGAMAGELTLDRTALDELRLEQAATGRGAHAVIRVTTGPTREEARAAQNPEDDALQARPREGERK